MKKKIFEALTVFMLSTMLVAGTGQTRTSETDISEPIVKEDMTSSLELNSGVARSLYSFAYEDSINVQPVDIPVEMEAEPDTEIQEETDIVIEESEEEMQIDEGPDKSGWLYLSSTAYYNKYNNLTADGSETIAGLTLAGKREWLGRSCNLYRADGTYMGQYEFHDTGYGRDGDIPRGETIDIFFDTYEECIDYGRRHVYVEFLD